MPDSERPDLVVGDYVKFTADKAATGKWGEPGQEFEVVRVSGRVRPKVRTINFKMGKDLFTKLNNNE